MQPYDDLEPEEPSKKAPEEPMSERETPVSPPSSQEPTPAAPPPPIPSVFSHKVPAHESAPLAAPSAETKKAAEEEFDHLNDLFVPDPTFGPKPKLEETPKLFDAPVQTPPVSPYSPATYKPPPWPPATPATPPAATAPTKSDPVPIADILPQESTPPASATEPVADEPLLTQISRPISWEVQKPTQRSRSKGGRRRITKIETWSVLKFSLLFYSAVMLIGLLAVMILFYAASAAGIVDNTESFIRGVGWPEFRIRAASVFRITLLLGVLQIIFWSTVNLVLTFLYNLVSDVGGGIEVTVSD